MTDARSLSAKQRLALQVLAGITGTMGTAELAVAVDVSSGIAALTITLRERGLIRCTRDDTKPRANRWRWSLSDAGRELVRQIAGGA
jgi:hypothetical protein